MDNRKLDFYSSRKHFFDHMIPIWVKLPKKYRGTYYIGKECESKAIESKIDYVIGKPTDKLCLVASYGDYSDTKGEVIYMEHGIGNTYSNNHPSYAGGVGKGRVVFFLNQHHLTQEKNIKAYPNAKQEIIGTPKMDKVGEKEFKGQVVCLSFHWDCKIIPETRSAFPYYLKALRELKNNKRFKLVMHGHPREDWSIVKRLGIEFIPDMKEVLDIADVYVCDNSSSIYEFMYTGKPVIYLNQPCYRKNVNHGIRFWTHIGGLQVDNPNQLLSKIIQTLDNPNEYKEIRENIIEELYPYRGKSTEKVVNVLKEYLDQGDKNVT